MSVAVVTAMGLALMPAPVATGADNTAFELSNSRISAYGTYRMMSSVPERPVPPIAIQGTLAVNNPARCGVVQLAKNGPADGIEWTTLASLCRRGKTNFRTTTSFLWGGARPPVRLCTGGTKKQAELGRNCDVYTPPLKY